MPKLPARQPALSVEAMDAIVNGRHSNVFEVLGWHVHARDVGSTVRIFLPWANDAELLVRSTHDSLGMLRRVHADGLFEISLALTEPAAYVLRINGELILEDPYRFPSSIDPYHVYLFSEGTAAEAYRWLGAHQYELEAVDGVRFVVWAPGARRVSVVGDFNGWDGRQHVMRKHPGSGVWELFLPGVDEFASYKYEILDGQGQLLPHKADPYARSMQHAPQTASRVVCEQPFAWSDAAWVETRAAQHHLDRPVAIYEVHLGSWRRRADEGDRYLSYPELADALIPYAKDLGFTHLQLMPISEYPFDGSWGYQPVGLYAPTIRYGTPDEFRGFVDACHAQGLGVLLDWVPGHFPADEHGLSRFDGSCLYEHEDPRQGFHPDWKTFIYNYSRSEIVSFLLSNANYWLSEFHVDGLRVDAVASMLYLDYSRKEGEWIPNRNGGRENLDAIALLQAVNTRVYHNHPGIMMIAEESTAWSGVSQPVDAGGLGFGFKWNMGWMNDTLQYMARDPVHRRFHHDEMTFGIAYAWDEHFVLPLSHDEVVHGKRSLLEKMPGDDWQKFANLRAYLGFMWAHPGKKLLFMGGEFAQRREWNHDRSLDWHLLDAATQPFGHAGMQDLVRDLNALYRSQPALYARDAQPNGFAWLQMANRDQSVFAWVRYGNSEHEFVVVIANMTPATHFDYQLGVPKAGWYQECLNTDKTHYGGSGQSNTTMESQALAWDGQPHSIFITVPPLATVVFECDFAPGVAN